MEYRRLYIAYGSNIHLQQMAHRYKTGTEQNVNLVLNTIREAKKKEKVTAELQLHSDQGFQYTSHGSENKTV